MTDQDLKKRVDRLCESVERVNKEFDELKDDVSENSGKIDVMLHMMTSLTSNVKDLQSDVGKVGDGVDRASSVKTAITFASVVLVPIIVAVIGGYFALKGAAPPK